MKSNKTSFHKKWYNFFVSPPVILGICYITCSLAWMFFSDKLSAYIAGNDHEFHTLLLKQKRIYFIILTGILLYLFINHYYLKYVKSFKSYKGLEATFYGFHEASKEGIFDCDLENMQARLNKKMQFFLPGSGNSIDNFWASYQKRVAPSDVNRLVTEYEEIVNSLKESWQTEFGLLGADNKYYTVLSSIYVIRNPTTNKAIRLVGAIQDVSDLRNLQAEYFKEQINNKHKIATSVIEAQEKEKNRWAEELHDNVCQLLSVAKLNLSAIDTMPDSRVTLTNEAKKLVTESINEIRQLSYSLKPPTFSDKTLLNSIEQLTMDIQRIQNIEFTIEAESFNPKLLTPDQELLVYRVVQEQLTNITKYASASKVYIRLKNNHEVMKIGIEDNGKGFNPSSVKAGVGLRNIQSRIEMFKGTMKTTSSSGNGYKLEAEFYLKN